MKIIDKRETQKKTKQQQQQKKTRGGEWGGSYSERVRAK